MLSTARVPHPQGRAQLINNLHMQRTRDPEPNVEKVFWRGARLDKVPLADALWPVLEAKINDAIQLGKPGPPVMKHASGLMRWRPSRKEYRSFCDDAGGARGSEDIDPLAARLHHIFRAHERPPWT